MIRLDSALRKLQIVLGGAVSATQPDIVVSYSDKTSTAYTGASQFSTGNSATPVDICSAPAASTVRDVDHICVRNNDSAAIVATIRYNDNATIYKLVSVTLAIGDTLEYTHAAGFFSLDANGNHKESHASLFIAAGKTLTISNTITLTGTDGASLNISNAVTGPASATDNAITRFDATTGKLVQNSVVTIGDTGDVAGAALISSTGYIAGYTALLTTYTGGAHTPQIQVAAAGEAIMATARFSANSSSPRILLGKSRGATIGAMDATQSGDGVGTFSFQGSDGTNFIAATQFTGAVDAAVSTGIVPGRSVISTANSAGTLTEAVRVDSSQKTLLTSNTSTNAGGVATTIGQSNRLQVAGNAASVGGVSNAHYAASAVGPVLALAKSRSGTIGTSTIVQSGDSLGEIDWYGASGSGNYDLAAQIIGESAGTPGSSADMPGRLRLLTTPDGSATPLDRLWIESDGTLQQYFTRVSATDYSRIAWKVASTTLASVNGATVTATNLIPTKARVLGVNTKVTVALGTGGGNTGYQVGDGTDADRWGNVTGTATTTDTDQTDATADPSGYFNAANNVVITANGGNFNGTGSIRIDVFYTMTEAD